MDAKEFLQTVNDIIRGGATRKRGIDEAIVFANAMIESLMPERERLIHQFTKLSLSIKNLSAKAKNTGDIEDVCAWSKAQGDVDELGRMLEDSIKVYSTVDEKLKELRHDELARTVPVVKPSILNVDKLRGELAKLVVSMTGFWMDYDDSQERRVECCETLRIDGKELILQVADVRGDGACGWRAYIAGIVRIITGGKVRLSYDPARMSVFLPRLKELLLELVKLLMQNPANSDFIDALFTVPQNGGRNTFDTYAVMISKSSYQATNFELRLLCMLFGLFDDRIAQVNIIRHTPYFGEIYQSITVSGRVAPVSNAHINIMHVPGHYKSIVNLTEGVLPHICNPNEAPLRF